MSAPHELPTPVNRVCYNIGKQIHITDYGEQWKETRAVAELKDAHVASSQVYGTDMHYPVLDLDVKHTLVPSSTPGHSHLYLDTPVSWRKYKKMLKAMADAGVLEKGYVRASIKRNHTAVRLPWIKKEKQ